MLPFDLVCIDIPYPLPPPPPPQIRGESKENLEVSESTLNK